RVVEQRHHDREGEWQRTGDGEKRRLGDDHGGERGQERYVHDHGGDRPGGFRGGEPGVGERGDGEHGAADRNAEGLGRQHLVRAFDHVVEQRDDGGHGEQQRLGVGGDHRLGDHHGGNRGQERLLGDHGDGAAGAGDARGMVRGAERLQLGRRQQCRPWNLATALSGGNGKVQPGDTVWLRGGTYAGQFRSTLTGTAAAPIVVRQYPGERAIIDGGGSTSDTF